jgi:hypothetical protein
LPGTDLPSGVTMRGTYALGSDVSLGELNWTSISFIYALASAPTGHVIPEGGTPLAECPGTSTNPQANAGNLCIYEGAHLNRSGPTIFNPATGGIGTTRWGAGLTISAPAAGRSYSYGTWAVTSP